MSVILYVQEVLKMDDKGTLSKALSTSQSASIKSIINRTVIVEWGTIKNIVAKGVVDVLLAVTDRPENTTVVTCPLVSTCAKSIAIDIEPQIGDKVLVLSPRRFDVDMFTLSDSTEVIERPNFTGYNNLSCVAILFNQFRPDSYAQNISINQDGVLTIAKGDKSLTVNLDGDNGITISDSNGMKIESTSTSTKINGKLEIKV